MMKEWFSASAQLNMEMFGLVIFVIVFSVIGLWVFRKNGKDTYNKISELPLMKEKEL